MYTTNQAAMAMAALSTTELLAAATVLSSAACYACLRSTGCPARRSVDDNHWMGYYSYDRCMACHTYIFILPSHATVVQPVPVVAPIL
jgi:hypothetical protein